MITKRLFIVSALVSALAGPVAHADAEADRAVNLTQTLLTDARGALKSPDVGQSLRGAVNKAFAFDIWAKFLTKGRAEHFSDNDRDRFRKILPGFLAHLYREQFDRGLTQPPEIGAALKVRGDQLVASTFKRPNGRNLPVEWRIREFPDRGPQVIDIMVGGTSFLLLKRDEFTAIIDRDGVPALFIYLEKNTL